MISFGDACFSLPPVAGRLGPFPHGDYLNVVWKHSSQPEEDLRLVGNDLGAVPLVVSAESVRFVGCGDLVDYRSPLGDGAVHLIASSLEEMGTGCRVVIDSLPEDAALVVAKGVELAGREAVISQHSLAAVLDLPATFDDYLTGIGKKERHETRRKRRRYETLLGPIAFARVTSTGKLFDEFIRLHRLADGEKGGFMTDDMVGYFADLIGLDGWGIDALVDEDERMVAGGFAFQDDAGYFLYNSAFDPDRREVSPGVVLLSSLIDLAIQRGLSVFDFLKGDEAYKFRLGAVARPLFVVTAMT